MTAPAHAAAHFPNDASSSSGARRFVTATLDRWGLDDLDEVASLLVSELVSNALLHAGSELDVHLHRSPGRVRIEVHDCSPRLPERKFYSTTSVTGRGLVFVSELAASWGFEPTADGKAVWFELDQAAAPAAPAFAAGDLLLDDWGDWGDDEPVVGGVPSRPANEPTSGGPGTSVRASLCLVGPR